MARDVRSLGYGDMTMRPRLKAIGIGGAGCNTITGFPLPSVGLCSPLDHLNGPSNQRRLVLSDEEVSSLRSPFSHLLSSMDRTFLRRLKAEVDGYDLIFLFAGLGGETGSHITPGLAHLCRRMGSLVVASVTLPFSAEGSGRRETAAKALPTLIGAAHLTVTYPNDGLIRVAPNLPLRRTFKVMDNIMTVPPQDLAGVLTRGDLKMLRAEIASGGHMRMGAGAGMGMQKERVAVSEAFSSPWFDFDLDNARLALVIISGRGVDQFSVEEVLGHVEARVPGAKIRYGVRSDPSLENLRVTILLDGAP
ncbi:MAG: hypothetical protein GX307_01080 [Euryarchaeota archaeon]|nr:hypothetical protein [Euryarchaeota archaeon]